MNCEHYQRLLHLNRPGEISPQEADDLRKHLRLCERCTLELKRIGRADEFFDRLARIPLTPAHPEQLTADVLRRVRAESVVSRPRNRVDHILDFFLIPVVRYSAVTLVLLVVGTLMAQLFTTMNSISNLEQRMAGPTRSHATEVTYSMRSKTLQDVASSQRGQSLRDNLALTVTNDRIDVSAKKVDSFLSGQDLNSLSAILGSTVFGIDRNTVEKIVAEIKASAESTFRLRPEGA
jgi:anti-sigma factor RsiW